MARVGGGTGTGVEAQGGSFIWVGWLRPTGAQAVGKRRYALLTNSAPETAEDADTHAIDRALPVVLAL